MSDMNAMNLAGSAVSGLMQGAGSIWQGYLNQQTQRETNAMQIDLANTAVQRRQADLARSGINPLMAGKIGGAETPTLQAPQMRGIPEAASAVTPNAIQERSLALQQQAMNIKQTEADTNNKVAEAAFKNTQTEWFPKTAQAGINLQEAQGSKAKAETMTIEALRDPMVKKTLQEVAESVQRTSYTAQLQKSEEQRTKELTAIANTAETIWGAKAKEAVEAARQLLTAGKYQLTELQQKQDINDQTIEALKNDNFRKTIDNILRNKYGNFQELSKIPLGMQLGSAVADKMGIKTPMGTTAMELGGGGKR